MAAREILAHLSLLALLFSKQTKKVFIYIYLFERERERAISFIHWFTTQMPIQPGLGQDEKSSLELHAGLLCGWQWPKHLAHYLLLSRCQQGAALEAK